MIKRFAFIHQVADWFGVLELLLEITQLPLFLGQVQIENRLLGLRVLHIFRARYLHLLNVVDVLRNRQDVQFIINCQASATGTQAEYEPLVEARLNNLVSFGPVPRVDIHCNFVQLFQTRHRVEEHDYDSASLNSLHRSAEDVGCERLEILKNTHTKSLPKNLVRILIIAASELLARHEELNLVDLFFVQISLRFHFLDLLQPLLAVA